ncbi:MAG: protease modulator HflC [Acidobacteriota bacterium]
MTRRRRILAAAAASIITAVLVVDSVFEIDETEQVILTQFGDPVETPVETAGLHFKAPLIQRPHIFDKRLLEFDAETVEVPTKDKFFIRVDYFCRWRIAGPLRFLERVHDERGALARIDEILGGEIRNTVAGHDLVELVRTSNRTPDASGPDLEGEPVTLAPIQIGRTAIERDTLMRASARMADLGISVIDIRFKQIDYVPAVQNAIFARMIAERKRVAELYRSLGEAEFARVAGERAKELMRIESDAYREAQTRLGAAEARAARIYADAYGRDPGFYAFVKRLESYEKTLNQRTTVVLNADSPYLRALR